MAAFSRVLVSDEVANSLPGAARRRTTAGRFFRRRFAYLRHRACFVFDRERVTAGLCRGRDFIAGGRAFCGAQVGGRGAHRDRDRFLDFVQLRRADGRVVAAVVRRDRLRRRLGRARELLRRGVGGLALLVQERRDRDRGEDAMIRMTTRSSISVKPLSLLRRWRSRCNM